MSILRRAPILAVLLSSAPALADEPEPPAPGFTHLGPDGRGNEVSAELGVVVPTSDGADFHLFRLQLTGQGIDPRSGFGGYGSVTVAIASGSGDSATGIGAAEVGGLYHRALTEQVDATVRLGVVLPTNADDDGVILFGTLYQDVAEYPAAIADAAVVRLAVTPTYHQGALYARADLGIDEIVSGENSDASPIAHAHLAVGTAPKPVGGAVELVTICTTDSAESDQCIHQIAAEAQIKAGRGVAMVGLSLPFGFEGSDPEVVNLELGFRGRL